MDWVQKLHALPTGRDPQSTRRRKQLFREIDENGNGILSLAEADNAVCVRWGIDLPKNVINRAFHGARDMAPPVQDFSDDYIDFGEFRIFMVYLQHYYDLYNLFTQLDTSGDQRLGLNEFVQAYPLLQSWGVQGLDDPTVTFQKMDADGGGMILFDEFAHWALHQGVPDMSENAAERAEALAVLKAAKANLATKEFDDAKHAQFNVNEGISGQASCALSAAQVGKQMLRAGLNLGPGRLVVSVHQANNLRIADRTTSDPYAVLSFGGTEQRTKTIKRNLNPIWNETVRFPDIGDVDNLEINVFDYDVFSADDFLGRVVVDEKTLSSAVPGRMRLNLTGPKAQGTIDVTCRFQRKRQTV